MKTNTFISFLMATFFIVIIGVDLSAQMKFKDLVRHPVLTYGEEGEWDDGYVWSPTIIKDGDTLRMWYRGSQGDLQNTTTGHIGYAWSLDGIEWNRYPDNPVVSATFDWEGDIVGNPVVIKDGDTLKMWYEANKNGYAESLDGINWTKHPEPLTLETGPQSDWDDGFLWVSTIIKEDNEYKMWYSGGRPDFPWENAYPQVGLATSPDGINWTKYDDPTTQNAPYAFSDPVLRPGEENDWDFLRAYFPKVIKTDTGYTMFYTGIKGPVSSKVKQQTGLAYSTDGINWIKDEQNPIIKDDHTVVDWGRGIMSGAALHYNDRFHYWFCCEITPPYSFRPQIGYAVQLISCLPEGIEFTTQAEIDSFQTNCPNCNVVEGDVSIIGEDITDLSGLRFLTSIGGGLSIVANNMLSNLTGLENLSAIEGGLTVGYWFIGNPSLQSLAGLNNLTQIAGDLNIHANPVLSSLNGLESLTSVGGNFNLGNGDSKSKNTQDRMNGNISLKSLTGLENLITIGGSFSMMCNDSLTSLEGLGNLDSVGGLSIFDPITSLKELEQLSYIGDGGIWIGYTDLTSLTGLENVIMSETYLDISFNDSLCECDMQSICNFLVNNPPENINIFQNASGCNSQQEVEEDCDNNCLPGGFSPYYQEDIDNFPSQFTGCCEIVGNVSISSSQITNLDSLYVIKSVGGNLAIFGCSALSSLNGLDSLISIGGDLKIYNNNLLSECEAYGICNYLSNPAGEIFIENNAYGCDTQVEVEGACSFFIASNEGAHSISIHPNPFPTTTTIEYELTKPSSVQLTIYDYLGKQLEVIEKKQAQGKQQITWNAEGMPAGVYFCVIKTNKGTNTTKLIKL